jgi:hypothetical protein
MGKAHRKSNPTKKSSKSSGGGGCATGTIPALGNAEAAELLLGEAARIQGVSENQIWLPTHADEFKFANDGDGDGPGTGRRQQDAALPALRPKHEGKEYEDFETASAFVKGEDDKNSVAANDVKQGALGDCYLIAGMAAVARADPKLIKKLITDNGDGTFDVSLYIRPDRYVRPRLVTTTVDSRLAVKHSGKPLYAGIGDQADGQDEIWTALIEKAVAQQKGSYDLISGSKINKHGFNYAGTSELLTGKRGSYLSTDGMDTDEALLQIDLALEEGRPVVASSRNLKDDPELTREANEQNVYWNHAYAPVSVDLNAETMDLQNPWGSSHVDDLSAKDFLRFYKAIRLGGTSR